ncbi:MULTISPECIES: oligoendopeptidase F [Bacillota]|uniref:Oligopeptidase F n=1 Tax=[Eubacterium] hominis TaxID=2764325 RepID=A0A7G9GJC0_9FIRM|nr:MULTISPECIES: oligoendopeptidase F [Bacillota]QNM10902.1 oligoendopeptidase F [[Eubacterium] hominis]RGB58396.1 oligoendopeptidase F [Absiella sp. AM22-9]RGB63283.1 oligoendopeptidase F [Absiella sp. AM10-20]RGB67113.1 oligoendopeptidase F [Absiella sp. AM09-45]RGB76737.1 oligoendopeptidase F [Absiella sp. AM09-50]
MKRNEIETELTWDLSGLFKDQKAFDDQFEKAKAYIHKLCQFKGHIADSKNSFIAFMNTREELMRYMENIEVYASMCVDVDSENEAVQENLSKANSLIDLQTSSLTFIDNEIIASKDAIETYLKDEDCKDFRYAMSEIFRTIPHRLDEKTEALLGDVVTLAKCPEDTFRSFPLNFEPVIVDGKEEFLNGATYISFLQNKDVDVRKQAFEHYFKEYQTYQNVFMNTLSAHAKGQVLLAKARNFKNALSASLFEDGVEEDLFHKVLYMGNEKYHDYVQEYFSLRKEILQLDVQHVYDIQLELVNEVDVKYSIDDCFDIMDEALKVLGDDYIQLLHKAKAERWIDFMPCKGKRSGAYSWGTYDSKPYIMTNFNGDYESLSTLAHELGHSMHSYFSWENNRAMNSGYRIFVAEVASTVNEVLLNDYLLKTSKDNNYKAYILSNLLTQLIGTLYRQPMYAKFEYDLHTWVENKEVISSQKITQHFLDLNKQYFGDSVEVDDLQRYGCYYIPHFYYNFYVYKYTLGMSVALSFVKRIQQGDVQAYREFLTKGGSESPLDELIHAGVDPRDDQVYDDAFTFFKETLDQFKELVK